MMTIGELNSIYIIAITCQTIMVGICIYFGFIKKLYITSKKRFLIPIFAITIIIICTILSSFSWFINYNSLKGQLSLYHEDYELSVSHLNKALNALEYINGWCDSLLLIKKETITYNLGLALFNKTKYNKAISEFEKSLNIAPNQLQPYVYLAEAYHKTGNVGQVLKYHKLIANFKQKDKSYFYYFNVGKSYSYLKEYDKAIDAFKKALDLNQDNKILHYYLSTCYSMKKNESKALEHLSIIINHNPKVKEIVVNDDIFFNNIKHTDGFKKLIEQTGPDYN